MLSGPVRPGRGRGASASLGIPTVNVQPRMRFGLPWLAGLAGVTALAVLAVALASGGDEGPDQSGPLRAVDVARDAGIYELTRSWSASAADFDGDGWDDLLLVRHKRGLSLYRNEEGRRFERMNRKLLTDFERSRDRHHCPFADVDRDGRLDFFCSVGSFSGTRPNPSELWLQRPDGTFVESAARYGVRDPYGRGRYAAFLDADADGLPDLFVGNEFPRKDGRPAPNRLFVNEAGQRFRSAPELGLDLEIGADSVQALDLDGDGYDDLAVCGKDEVPLHLFRNREGRGFADVSGRVHGGRRCRVAGLADIDGDGSPDLARLTGRRLVVHVQRDGELARAYDREVEAGRKLAIADATGDGRPDIFVLRSGAKRNVGDELLLNRSRGSELRFESIDVPTDLRGIGDTVTSIDHDGDGRAAFVVVNGKEKAFGAVQLIVLEGE